MIIETDKLEKFKSKVRKDYETFVESVERLSVEQLEENLMTYSKHRENTLLAKSNDEALNDAKEEVKELSMPYNETLKGLKAKMAYINILINEKK